jgi:hypothetical protein
MVAIEVTIQPTHSNPWFNFQGGSVVPNKNKIKIKIGPKDEIGLGLVMMLVSQLLPTQSKPPQPHRFSHNT